ncbi:MAG: hypothetical protein CM15mP64_7970 [Candidatus Neomarinimicrobiota bacterium]|nr:MAG: hypothetical protein CM15mP64_7970 [Candidatus Neomarinimicrobiota bacterium]
MTYDIHGGWSSMQDIIHLYFNPTRGSDGSCVQGKAYLAKRGEFREKNKFRYPILGQKVFNQDINQSFQVR